MKPRLEVLAQTVERHIEIATNECGLVLRKALREAQRDGILLAAGIAARERCDCAMDFMEYVKRLEREEQNRPW